jgi:heme ABC exporter ATP-binding subunit CcmA
MSLSLSRPSQRLDEPAAAPRECVSVAGLRKVYDGRPVLRDVSFRLEAGATLSLLGPNGAGKTTLLRVLATLVKPSDGAVRVGGWDVVRDGDVVRSLIGYVGHQPHVYEDLTSRENLLFFARMYGLPDGAARATKLLERVGLRSKADERARHLSRGQLQRLAIARGVLHGPALLLLDEPDTGLDEPAVELLEDVVRSQVSAGRSAVLTTHRLERGLAWSEQVAVLVRGRVVHSGDSSATTAAQVRDLFQQGGR